MTVTRQPAEGVPERASRSGTVLIAAMLLLIGMVIALWVLQQRPTTIVDAFPDESTRPPPVEVAGSMTQAQNILLLGSDTWGKIGGLLGNAGGDRSDTIMVVHIPADRDNIQVMSMMRDSWVPIPGHGEEKLNAALAWGDVPLAVQTVEGLIDVRIDHVAIIDYEGFRGITDALGGVTIDNATAFTSVDGVEFAAGRISLDGEQALGLVRERFAFGEGDFQRVRNQQLFIQALAQKAFSRDTLTDPAKVVSLATAIRPFLAVDEGMSIDYASRLAFELRGVSMDDMMFFTMPTLGIGNVGEQSIVRVDHELLEVVSEHFKADTLDQFEPEVQRMYP